MTTSPGTPARVVATLGELDVAASSNLIAARLGETRNKVAVALSSLEKKGVVVKAGSRHDMTWKLTGVPYLTRAQRAAAKPPRDPAAPKRPYVFRLPKKDLATLNQAKRAAADKTALMRQSAGVNGQAPPRDDFQIVDGPRSPRTPVRVLCPACFDFDPLPRCPDCRYEFA